LLSAARASKKKKRGKEGKEEGEKILVQRAAVGLFGTLEALRVEEEKGRKTVGKIS